MDLSTEFTPQKDLYPQEFISQLEVYPKEFTQAFFEESSKAWMLNKKRYGASYAYVCGKPKCKNRVKEGGGVLCKYHQAKIGIRETPHIQLKGFDSKPMNEWLEEFNKAPTLTPQKVKEQPN